ncbi:hypothetical protein [Monaibacterium marinum]|uniref:hypothetical protein n=1 Tax=Pontivivens marinum TaxID=1690039 RepID=UPI0015E08E6B|nr:hypothetical protein [Monaibacterium marinum]
MDRISRPTTPIVPTHLPAEDKLRADIVELQRRAVRFGCPATAQALGLAVEMFGVEVDAEDQ